MQSTIEQSVRFSRRGQWFSLFAFLLAGAYSITTNIAPDNALVASLHSLAPMFPIAIVFVIVAMQRGVNKAARKPDGAAMQSVLNDELRLASINAGMRNAFFAMLALQAVLSIALALWHAPNPVTLMASLTVIVGGATLVASMLILDR